MRTIEHQILSGGYAPVHPERVRLAKELEFAEELRRLREAQLDDQWHRHSTGAQGCYAGNRNCYDRSWLWH